MTAEIYMRFLYPRAFAPLEILWRNWHFICADTGVAQGACPDGGRLPPFFERGQCRLPRVGHVAPRTEGRTMLDLIVLAVAAGFFVLSVGYAYACDRL